MVVRIVDRTHYKIFGKKQEISNVSYTVLKGVDKKLYLSWIVLNNSGRPVKVNFSVLPKSKAFKFSKKLRIHAHGVADQKFAIEVDKLSDIWNGSLVMSADGKNKKIPMHFEKSMPIH